ncbi:hypothetical protein LI90_4212 [Carbonactinospora thermoautotrophica]|uniref:Uncharacterized protein n=1 Tax=Carbonactinospora thermoautotrophica TaxID=1469144 RepID=A0A132MZ32_9ACTN|nr:hypothetical protein LI90_4212 [Carbonactinospora thermoautotrophica]
MIRIRVPFTYPFWLSSWRRCGAKRKKRSQDRLSFDSIDTPGIGQQLRATILVRRAGFLAAVGSVGHARARARRPRATSTQSTQQ